MKHLKTFLIEREEDKSLGSPERFKRIAMGYSGMSKEEVVKICEELNKDCKSCPRRTALHTTFRLIEPYIHIRLMTADDTYKEKLEQNRPS